jgi:predicted RNase H-like HicB family nuclease
MNIVDQQKFVTYHEGMKSYTYRIIIEKDEKSFHAYAPALPGCHSFGKTIPEARRQIRDAIKTYILSLIDDKQKIPRDSSVESVETVSISLKPSYA